MAWSTHKQVRTSIRTGTRIVDIRFFRAKQEEEYSELKPKTKARVHQRSMLDPVSNRLFTYDIPEIDNIKTATFAEDAALLAVEVSVAEATHKLRRATDE